MPRLPKIGGDANTWGQVLNEFLSAAHNTDGTIKTDCLPGKVETTTAILPGAGLVGGGDLSSNRTLSVNFGTVAGTVAAGNDMRIAGALQSSNNLGDLISPTAARDNIGAAQNFNVTAVKTSAYTTLAGDFVPVDASGGNVTITLPTAPHDKTRVGVKLINLGGSTNTVTIASGGGDVFNKTGGATSLSLSITDQAMTLQYNATSGVWYAQDGLPLTQLDARYSVASTATKLATARSINGVAFDGSADITVPAAGSTLSDTVTVANGGTGATTLTGVIKGNGASAMTAATAGTDYLTPGATQTVTATRITKRTGATTSSATPTINTDNVDFYSLTAQAVDITSFTTNLTGTPTQGQTLWVAITGTSARAITWGASFEASTVALPTTTVSTNRLDIGFVWDTATSKWHCVAVA